MTIYQHQPDKISNRHFLWITLGVCPKWAHLSHKWYRLFVAATQIHQDIRTDKQEREPV